MRAANQHRVAVRQGSPVRRLRPLQLQQHPGQARRKHLRCRHEREPAPDGVAAAGRAAGLPEALGHYHSASGCRCCALEASLALFCNPLVFSNQMICRRSPLLHCFKPGMPIRAVSVYRALQSLYFALIVSNRLLFNGDFCDYE